MTPASGPIAPPTRQSTPAISRLAGQLHRLGVDGLDEICALVALQPRPGGAEGRGFDQFGARLEVGEVDVQDRFGIGEGRRLQLGFRGQPGDELGAHGSITHDNVLGEAATNGVTHGGGRTSLDSGMTGLPRSESLRSGNPPPRVRVTVAPT